MTRRSAFVLLMAALATISIAKAASTFDGQWKGEGKPTSSCLDTAAVTFTIKDGDFVAFLFTGPKGSTTNVKGRITDNGVAASYQPLVAYCQQCLAIIKPQWQIIAEQHGWGPKN